MSANCLQKVILEMTPVQTVAVEAPVRVATCPPIEQRPVEIDQTIGDRNKQNILQGNHIFRLDMYPA